MINRLRNIAHSLKLPATWAFFILFALALIAQRVYLIRLGDRLSADKEYITALKNQNDGMERDIERLIETKRLECMAELDYGLRSAELDEVVVLAEPYRAGTAERFGLNKAFSMACRRFDDLVLGPFVLKDGGIGGSI